MKSPPRIVQLVQPAFHGGSLRALGDDGRAYELAAKVTDGKPDGMQWDALPALPETPAGYLNLEDDREAAGLYLVKRLAEFASNTRYAPPLVRESSRLLETVARHIGKEIAQGAHLPLVEQIRQERKDR